MPRALAVFIVLCGTFCSAETQKLVAKINPSLPAFELRIHKIHSAESDWFDQIDWVQVWSVGHMVQDIKFRGEGNKPTLHHDDRNALAIRDVDCDGYKDILIQHSVGTSANTWYYLFRFDPPTGKFIEYKPFAKLSFVSVSCKNKIVKTYLNSGQAGCAYESDEYQWVQGELKHTRRESQTMTDDEAFVRTVRTWRDGKVKTQTRKIDIRDCHQP